MRFRSIITAAAVTAGTGALLMTTAAASFASTTPAAHHQAKPVEAITTIVGRHDSGGGGTWANDRFTRDLKVYYLGKSTDPTLAATPYMYYATVSDKGTFQDIPGQLTPNQGAPYAGVALRPTQVSGPMSGFGQWSVFYASQKAHNGLAPTHLGRGISNESVYASVTWPELAFPSGTTFAGPNGSPAMNEVSWGYDYYAVPVTVHKIVNGKKVTVTVYRQHWSDTALNGAGQLPRDGNILGLR